MGAAADGVDASASRSRSTSGSALPFVHRVLVTFGTGDALRDQASQSVPVGDMSSATTATFARACTARSADSRLSSAT